MPALETSLPAPSTVLHALKNVDAPVRTIRLMKAMARFLRMTTPLLRENRGYLELTAAKTVNTNRANEAPQQKRVTPRFGGMVLFSIWPIGGA